MPLPDAAVCGRKAPKFAREFGRTKEPKYDRDARVVAAPPLLAGESRIGEQCLITRCSSVENNCQIDYGTVVEDSSILSNTYVGIGLDLSHSIVDGSGLMNLERDVSLEIADPCVIRQNRLPRPVEEFPFASPIRIWRHEIVPN